MGRSGRWGRTVLDALPDGVLVSDANGRVTYANPGPAEMSGYRREEIVGQPIEMLVPAPMRERHLSRAASFRSAPSIRLMGRSRAISLQRRDGSRVAVEVGLAPMALDGETVTVALIRDITFRISLQAERERLLEILELSPDPVVVVDAETLHVEYANQAAAQLTGYSVDELSNLPDHVRDSWLADRNTNAFLKRLAENPGSVRSNDVSLSTRSGEQVPVDAHCRLVTEADGTRRVIVVLHDQRPRRAREELLQVSEESFRTAFEDAPVGALVTTVETNGDRRIILANQALADMYGTTVADMIGSSLEGSTLSADQPRDTALFQKLAHGRIQSFPLRRQQRRADGSIMWVEARVSAFALPGVRGPLALAHVVDVTDLMTQQLRLSRQGTLNECVSAVTTAALAQAPFEEVLQKIVEGAATLVDADGAALGLGSHGDDRVRVEARHGDVLADLPAESSFLALPEITEQMTDETLRLAAPPASMGEPLASALGPIAATRFHHVDGRSGGYLAAVRVAGGPEFTAEEADELAGLATQTRLALQLSCSRNAQQRLALLEQRQRIARELHDLVIQDLIALGMQLVNRAAHDATARQADLAAVAQLEEAVRQLRRVVLELRVADRKPLEVAIRDLAHDASRVLGHEPDVAITGPVQDLPEDLSDDILAVVRESLSNVARHASAAWTEICLDVTGDQVTLTIQDDGAGPPVSSWPGYGLANIQHRATARRGRTEFGGGGLGGARLVWSCPWSTDAGTGVTGEAGEEGGPWDPKS